MPRQTKQRQARGRTPQQIDLFAGELRLASGNMPAWSGQGLPAETQTVLTDLMIRLILDHADKNRIAATAEAGHDL